MPYKDTVNDFNLKWANSYALHNEELVYVYGAQYDKDEEPSENNPYFVQLGYPKTGKRNKYDFDLESLTPILVSSQLFNIVDLNGPPATKNYVCAAALISRWPRRQNKRSVCEENTSLSSPMYPLLRQLSKRWPQNYRITFDIMQKLLTCQYPSYRDALDYCTLHGAVAVTPNFAVGLSPLDNGKYLLMSQFGFVGECDFDSIYVKHKGSFQEVLDFVSRQNLNLKVIDATTTS